MMHTTPHRRRAHRLRTLRARFAEFRCVATIAAIAFLAVSVSQPILQAQAPDHQGHSGQKSHEDSETHSMEAHAAQHHDQHEHEHHRNPDGMQHSFDDIDRWRARFEADERAGWQRPEEVIALLELEPGMTVADIGAGTGYFLPSLASAVGSDGRVLALDVEPNMVAFMAGRAHQAQWPHVEARRIPTDSPGLEPGSVDRVLLVNTWHHIGARPAYAGKLRAALRPGGTVTIVDYTLDSEDGPPKEHRLPADQIVEELEAGGLRAEIVEETLPRQFVVRGSLRE